MHMLEKQVPCKVTYSLLKCKVNAVANDAGGTQAYTKGATCLFIYKYLPKIEGQHEYA
jgi:hypothetical protein